MHDDTFPIGSGATIHLHSDSHACTIVARTARTMTVRRDHATLLNGPTSGEPDALVCSPGGFCAHMEGVQRYIYQPNEYAQLLKVTLRQNGRWQQANSSNRVTSGRHEHYDYNF